MIELKSIIVLFVNILKSEQVDSGRPDLAVMKPFEYKFCTHTPNSLNQNTVLIGYNNLQKIKTKFYFQQPTTE
jgi:hypothetical protein